MMIIFAFCCLSFVSLIFCFVLSDNFLPLRALLILARTSGLFAGLFSPVFAILAALVAFLTFSLAVAFLSSVDTLPSCQPKFLYFCNSSLYTAFSIPSLFILILPILALLILVFHSAVLFCLMPVWVLAFSLVCSSYSFWFDINLGLNHGLFAV